MSTSTVEQGSAEALVRQFRAVIFDYGMVLSQPPVESCVERIRSVFGFSDEEFWAAFYRLRPPYDKGEITHEEYWRRMARESGVKLSPEALTSLCRWDIEMWGQINQSMVRWSMALQATGYKTAVLSNAPLEFAKDFRERFEWLRDFDVSIFSAELSMAKPDAAIYRHCLQQLVVEPHEALFIDDNEHNVQAARTNGLAAIRFESVGQLSAELAEMRFQPLPEANSGS
jgi:putative hydrolase of the HAD superfamily